jgi:phage terminase large subunit-like protein
VLEENNLSRRFYWNKETITNLATGSVIRFRTSSAKTKDGGRPGMVVFDEYHAYENYDLVSVAETGLGKKLYPRKDIFTTDGNVRGGPLDDLKERADDILLKGADDMGLLPFVCCLDKPEEVDDKLNWYKANPSLQYFPTLYNEIEKEYARFKSNPAASSDFMTKRMNLPPTILVNDVASWDDICATNRPLPNLEGRECVLGIDYAKTSDMVAAGLLFYIDEEYYWLSHAWVCSASPAIKNVKAPLNEWRARGFLTFVDSNEVSPDVVIEWAQEQAKKYRITKIGMDNFRITLFRKALIAAGFDVNDKNRVMLTKRVTQMRYAPVIQSAFINHKIVWGDNPLMRWFTNNALADIDKQGNITFGKKNAKYRMTDGFMALVAAFGASAELVEKPSVEINIDDIMTYIG